jgi:hypothetical protein
MGTHFCEFAESFYERRSPPEHTTAGRQGEPSPVLDLSPIGGDAEAMRVFVADNVIIVLFRLHLPHAPQLISLATVPNGPIRRVAAIYERPAISGEHICGAGGEYGGSRRET